MNYKLVLFAVFLSVSSFVTAQESHIKEYASFLVDIEQSIDKKAMNKSWKKRQSIWEEETLTVSSPLGLNSLSDEFISNLSTKVINEGSMPMLNFSSDYVAYGKSLIQFVSVLPPEITTINAKDFRTTVLAIGQDFKSEEMAARARELKTQVKSDFTPVFQIVFEDAKQGSFSKVAGSKIDEATYDVNKKMKLSGETKITIDEEKIYTYRTEVELTEDLESAKAILKNMIAMIKSMTPSGYIEGEWLDEAYVDRTIYQYEFEAEIFSVTAKKTNSSYWFS